MKAMFAPRAASAPALRAAAGPTLSGRRTQRQSGLPASRHPMDSRLSSRFRYTPAPQLLSALISELEGLEPTPAAVVA